MAEEKKKSSRELQAEYDALAKRAAAFDPETNQMLRKLDKDRADAIADRKAAREKLVADKGKVAASLREAIASEAADAAAKEAAKSKPATK